MTEPLVHDVTLKCSIAHAFDVFTQQVDLWWPKGHRRFDTSTLRHEAHVGGQLVEISLSGEVFVLADVVSCDPPHQITLAWHPGKITEPTQTVVTFSPQGPHEAYVRVIHAEGNAALGDEWAHRATLFNKGWIAVLAALDEYIKQESSKR